GDTGGRTRAAIDAIVHTVAVAVTLATKVIYVRTRCGAGAAVNTVGYAVTVSVHGGAAGTAKRKLQAETEYVVPEILAKQVVTALPILAPECYVAAAKNIRQEPDPAGNHQAVGVIRAVRVYVQVASAQEKVWVKATFAVEDELQVGAKPRLVLPWRPA